VFTFSAGVSDATANPARFGMTYQLSAVFGESGHDWGPTAEAVALMRADRDVTAVTESRVEVAAATVAGPAVPSSAVPSSSAGTIDAGPGAGAAEDAIALFSYAPGRPRQVPVVLTEGRMPRRPDEVALAPTTADELSAKAGSAVSLSGRRFTVTGVAFVIPTHNSYSEGGWITPEGYTQLFQQAFKYHIAVIQLRPGADAATVQQRLSAGLAAKKAGGGIALQVSEPPVEMAELRDQRLLPILLGAFLAVLAVGAVGHALATAVRRRRHEMAVMRALGMTRRQARGVIVTHASALAAIGVGFGVPLGLALGRTLWQLVAEQTPVFYRPPMAFLALVLIGPGALLAANLLAVWPGRQAARLHVSHVLRAE
jgi:hypothetical protein